MMIDRFGTGVSHEHPMWGPWPRKTGVAISFTGEIRPLEEKQASNNTGMQETSAPSTGNGKCSGQLPPSMKADETVITARQKKSALRTQQLQRKQRNAMQRVV